MLVSFGSVQHVLPLPWASEEDIAAVVDAQQQDGFAIVVLATGKSL